MTIAIRAYRLDEFERSCQIREISDLQKLDSWKERIANSGNWDDHYFQLAITKDELLIGDLQLRHCDKSMPEGALEIGVELDTPYRGQGIGTEVLKMASEKFFAAGAHRIAGSTEASNIAMIRAFEKAGWEREGVLRGLFRDARGLHDYVSFAVINRNT